MDRLYFTPWSCSIASMALLVECAHPFEAIRLQMGRDGAGDEAFARLSPLRQVPVLETGDLIIRETGAIIAHLSWSAPDRTMFARGHREQLDMTQWIGFVGGTVHPLFRILFRPERFAGDSPDQLAADLKRHTGRYLGKIMSVVDGQLSDREWILGRRTCLDFYLFAFTRWLDLLKLEMPRHVLGFHRRAGSLAAIRAACAIESGDGVSDE